MTQQRRQPWWAIFQTRLGEVNDHRSLLIVANDGIIATAGLLYGFAGAGASNRLLIFTAAAATISGAFGVGGAAWAEDAALRESQLALVEAETTELNTDPLGEFKELMDRWIAKGLKPETAEEVASQLSTYDALTAQLESEYGFTEPISTRLVVWTAVASALAYGIGGSIPFAISYFLPLDIETWVIVLAVIAALAVTSLWAARSTKSRPTTVLVRSLGVGMMTMAVSYLVAELLL